MVTFYQFCLSPVITHFKQFVYTYNGVLTFKMNKTIKRDVWNSH